MLRNALLPLSLVLMGAVTGANAQGINCESSDGRRLFVPGATSCPFGLAPSNSPGAAPMPPQKAAFAAKTIQEMAAVQDLLIKLNLLRGSADGLYGPATDTAIRGWQKAKGHPETGYLTDDQLAALNADAHPAPVLPPEAPQQFRCPQRGVLFTYASVSEPITVIGERLSLGGEGLSCFYFVRSEVNGSYADSQYYAGFWRALTEAEQAFLQSLRPDRVWPLAVGNKVEQVVPVGESTARVRIQVDGYGLIDTPLGRLPTYVVSMTEGDGSAASRSASTFWWSPDLGETVRFISSDGSSSNGGWQIVNVTR